MAAPPDVAAFLDSHAGPILTASADAVKRHRLPHYEAAGADETDERLRLLFVLLVHCSREHDLEPAFGYAESLASARHGAGYELGEVQRVVNSLEEAVWSAVTTDLPQEEQGYALGLVSTVLGAVKDRLACEYVARFTSKPVTLRLDSLFSGSEGSPRHA